MATGSNKRIVAVFACAIVLSLSRTEIVQGHEHRFDIWNVLRAGNFSGPMNEDAHVRSIKGRIAARGRRYKFWEYDWTEKRPGGHGATFLLVFEQDKKGLSYLGRYAFEGGDFRGDVHPEIRGKDVVFPYHDIKVLGIKQAAKISFDNGPPASALGSKLFR